MIYLSINRSKGKNQIVLFIDLEKKFDLKIHFGLSQMGSETLLEVTAMAAQGEPQVQFKVGNARELGVCCREQEGL